VKPGAYGLGAQISVTNAITVRSTDGAAATVLNANGLGRCVYMTNGVIDGFTITGGKTNLGGGVYCLRGGAVQNCIITGNVATVAHGGGVYCLYTGLVQNCLVTGNRAANLGGGVFLGGGGTVLNCTISGNAATNSGGGLYASSGGGVTNTIVYFNSAPSGANWTNSGSGFSYAFTCADPADAGGGKH